MEAVKFLKVSFSFWEFLSLIQLSANVLIYWDIVEIPVCWLLNNTPAPFPFLLRRQSSQILIFLPYLKPALNK
jgi:hypothetical protein